MTDKQKLERIKALADAMYDAAFNLTIDANQLMKSLHDYHQFIINEYHKEEPVSNDLELEEEITKCYKSRIDLMMTRKQFGEIIHRFTEWQKEQMRGEEPVSEELKEAAKHYLYSNIIYDDVYVGNPTDKDCIEMFKAGAEWQKQKDDEEKVLIYNHGFDDCKEQMMAELQAKDSMPVSDELEKVAELYTLDDKIKPWRSLTKEAFISGAKWKKEQMMAKAINTEASLTLSVPSICISLPHGVNVGDKVKVIVIKED